MVMFLAKTDLGRSARSCVPTRASCRLKNFWQVNKRYLDGLVAESGTQPGHNELGDCRVPACHDVATCAVLCPPHGLGKNKSWTLCRILCADPRELSPEKIRQVNKRYLDGLVAESGTQAGHITVY